MGRGEGVDRGERVWDGERVVDLLADDEAHDLGHVAIAEVVQERHRGTGLVTREVDYDVHTLCGGQLEMLVAGGAGEKPAVGADLGEGSFRLGVEAQVEASGVAGVDDAKPILCAVDLRDRPGGAVDEHDVAKDTGHVGIGDAGGGHQAAIDTRIGERPVGGEATVGDHHRKLMAARGQAEGILFVVAHEVDSGETAPDAGTGEVHPVVVVPEHRRPLVKRVSVGPVARGGVAHHRAADVVAHIQVLVHV